VVVGEDEFQPQAVIFSQPSEPEPVNKDEKEKPRIEEGQKKYKLENAPTITKPIMQQFIKAFEAGLLQEHLKSEPIPEENYGPLYKVVGENFDEMVNDSETDVFLEVYAPWCGHCKELAPTIKKLAKRFKDVPTVKICDMDGTANEHPLVKDAKGFPAIYFFPAGEKGVRVPWDEEEKRTVGGFTRFIQANAKLPFDLPKIKSKEEKAAEREAKKKAKEFEEAHEEL
jgi:protein disulfide isomerase